MAKRLTHDAMGKDKLDLAVRAAEQRLTESKVPLREKQKRFNELMSHND